jgi:F420-dependent oxidoreductase-like protein
MRLGLVFDYSGLDAAAAVQTAQHVESLGYHSIWTTEAYGTDALVPLTWMAAHTSRIHLGTGIMQIPARTPSATAQAAMTLDMLSGGRMLLGLGASGPQVAEGWHGQAYGRPLQRTREYVAVIREILKREQPLQFDGDYYQIPYAGSDATGLGKPLKTILHPRSDIPIYLAAIGPKNVALAGEIADGFLPIFWSPDRWQEAFGESLGGVDFSRFDIAASVKVVVGDDVDACRDELRPFFALYIGGMGAKGRNFYNDLAARYGYPDAAAEIQDHFLSGRRAEAAAAVPDALIDEVALVGPPERIAERLEAWRASPVTTLNVWTTQPHALDVMAEVAGI